MIYGHSRIVGVIGDPISHSLSPQLHNTLYDRFHLPFVYVPFHVRPEQLDLFFNSMRAFHYAGVNVTVPHKEAVIPYLDELSVHAQKIGAVNTIVNHDGRLIGHNTDGQGFLASLLHHWGWSPLNQDVIVLGAGGSARAICVALVDAGCRSLTIANRSIGRAQKLAEDLAKFSPQCTIKTVEFNHGLLPALSGANLVVNTTSVGMSPHDDACPLDEFTWVNPTHYVCDIIYKPAKTRFLQLAEAKGASVLNGAGMLAGQAALAFEHFTGHPILMTDMFEIIHDIF